MPVEVIDCIQGTEGWYRARLGIPTASEFATIMAKGRDGGESLTRKIYLQKLAGEIITGEPCENYSNAHMERGKAMEAEAREHYAFNHDADPQLVGFIRNGAKGCSPDSLIGANGALEIKTHAAHIMVELLLKDSFPPQHRAQSQGILWVAEREWIDLSCYWPKMPPFVKRAHRDDTYIAQIADAVDRFNDELAALVERVRRYGAPEVLAA